MRIIANVLLVAGVVIGLPFAFELRWDYVASQRQAIDDARAKAKCVALLARPDVDEIDRFVCGPPPPSRY
jgi:hypothetical protein